MPRACLRGIANSHVQHTTAEQREGKIEIGRVRECVREKGGERERQIEGEEETGGQINIYIDIYYRQVEREQQKESSLAHTQICAM